MASELKATEPTNRSRLAVLVAVALVTLAVSILSATLFGWARAGVDANVVPHSEEAWLLHAANADHIVTFGDQVQVAYRSTWTHHAHWWAASPGHDAVTGSVYVRSDQTVDFSVPTIHGSPQAWFTIHIGDLTAPIQVRLSGR
jgi:hypothetical protein